MDKAVFVFTPSHAQHEHLEMILDSIARHMSIPYQFCLFTDRISDEFSSKHDLVVKIISEADLTKLEDLYYREGRADIPAFSAYAQFVLPRYFSEYNSFIYMEVDQIVRADLAPLWLECIKKESPLSAAAFLDDDYVSTTVDSFNRIHPKAKCFNTGVLYVDVDFWLSHNFESLCFNELVIQKKLYGKRLDFYAQGAINNALHEYICEFSWLYNVPGFGSVRGISLDVINSAKVLHWTGPLKPWKEDGLYKDLYFDDSRLKNDSDYVVRFAVLRDFKIRFKRFVRDMIREYFPFLKYR